MKIGIDAKWYFEGPPSGKRVIRSLVSAILERHDDHEYFFFLNRKHRDRALPLVTGRKVTWCYVWAGNNLLSNIFFLPWFSRKYRIDAILYQNFISPFGSEKRIAYVHDVLFLSHPEYYTLIERVYLAPLKMLTRWADAIITVSAEERKRLLEFKLTLIPEMITVAHHGVEKDFRPLVDHPGDEVARVRGAFQLPERYILFVGRLNMRKNVDNLLRAIPLLKDKRIPLVIVGADDWKISGHRKTIEEMGIRDRVHFTGAVFADLPIIYSLATVFCFPSHAESFGLPPLEAMASGVPVVVSRTTSLPEICGTAGTYVSPDHPSEIAAAIDKLLTNSHLYERMRQHGLEQAKQFTWKKAADQVIASITSLERKLH